MKKIFITTGAITLLAFPAFNFLYAQDADAPSVEVHRVYKPLSISKAQLLEAETIGDLNPHFHADWIKSYRQVKISSTVDLQPRSALSANESLSSEQLAIMQTADVGSEIAVEITYLPENDLKQNDDKVYDFAFTIYPEGEASFPGGAEALQTYLDNRLTSRIGDHVFSGYKLAAIKFTIDHTGNVVNPHVFWSAEDEETDSLMLETINSMPRWKPAFFDNGTPVSQDFALMVGNMKSCVTNMLNIKAVE